MFRDILSKVAVVSLASVLVVCVSPVAAHAETSAELQSKLDTATATLTQLYEDAETATEALNYTSYQLDQTNTQIEQTQSDIESKRSELKDAQTDLSKRVSEDYKQGGVSLLSTLLSCSSFEDFVSHIYYMDKVTAASAASIQEVKDLQASLESQQQALTDQQTQQQTLLDQQTEQQATAQSKAEAQESYVSSLDQEVKDALAQEAEAAKAQQVASASDNQTAALAAIADAGTTSSGDSSSTATTDTGSSDNSSSNSGSSSDSGSSNSGSGTTSNYSGTTRQIIVQAAYSCIGCSYVLGAEEPGVAFDCSGLTQYAYACAGLSIPHSSSAQMAMTTIKPISQCLPGDIIFWYGHVAIYVGNGKIVHANYNIYGGCMESTLYGNYLGGGCPFDI